MLENRNNNFKDKLKSFREKAILYTKLYGSTICVCAALIIPALCLRPIWYNESKLSDTMKELM